MDTELEPPFFENGSKPCFRHYCPMFGSIFIGFEEADKWIVKASASNRRTVGLNEIVDGIEKGALKCSLFLFGFGGENAPPMVMKRPYVLIGASDEQRRRAPGG